MMRPKSMGNGTMILDFVEEKAGHLHLTDEEFDHAKQKDPTRSKHARQLLKYGEAREGHWTSEKFTKQIKRAEKICSC